MLGIVDRERIQRGYDYLKVLDNRFINGCHSVNLNSFAQLQLARVQSGCYNIAVCRKEDQCLLVYFTVRDGDQGVVDRIEKEMLEKASRPKCGVCTGVAVKGEYCELCSIMVTTIEDVCAICLEEERKSAVWVDAGCGHCYHHECFSRIRDSKCPLCRTVIEQGKIV